MSEKKVHYTSSDAQTIEAFKNRNCTLLATDNDYLPPTPEEVKNLRNILGLSQTGLAKLLGVSFTQKGSGTVRKWETVKGNKEHREIPYSAFRVMLIAAGILDDDTIRQAAEHYRSK